MRAASPLSSSGSAVPSRPSSTFRVRATRARSTVERYAKRALELDPTNTGIRFYLGQLYRIQRDVAGAENVLLDEAGQPVGPRAGLLLYQVYLERDLLEDALRTAQHLIDSEPEDLAGYMSVATAYERMGRAADAEAVLREALVHDPDRFVVYSRIARIRRSAGDRAGEIAVYHEVLVRRPEHYGTLVSLGETQISVGDIEGAVATYHTIVRQYPDDLQSIRRLASLEYSSGQFEAAARRLEAALVNAEAAVAER